MGLLIRLGSKRPNKQIQNFNKNSDSPNHTVYKEIESSATYNLLYFRVKIQKNVSY